MTFGIVLIRGEPEKMDDIEFFLYHLKDGQELLGDFNVTIKEVLKCFGWPDFILVVEAVNIEGMMQSIAEIRRRSRASLETTTFVCTSRSESDERIEEFSKRLTQFRKRKIS